MTDFVACFLEKLIMASIRKRKGTKTSLTTGKKSEKYRKLSQSLKLNQSLNPQQLLEQPISLEDDTDTNTTCELDQEVINEVHEHFTQVQSSQLNNSPIPIMQAKRSKILTHVEKELSMTLFPKYHRVHQFSHSIMLQISAEMQISMPYKQVTVYYVLYRKMKISQHLHFYLRSMNKLRNLSS